MLSRGLTWLALADNFQFDNKISEHMYEVIEKLIILQDRDRKISKIQDELARIPTEREQLSAKFSSLQRGLDAAKLKVKQIETDRKQLELEAEAKKQQIAKYSLQQFQTKKNEEYRALAHEIELCKENIVKLEDQQLDLMEGADGAQTEVAKAVLLCAQAKGNMDSRMTDLGAREQNLMKELSELETNRTELASAVEDGTRSRYERLMKQKGNNVVVGIHHSVCGGCHMQLSRQTVVSCQADEEIVTCHNCGRILYYTRDMDMVVAD